MGSSVLPLHQTACAVVARALLDRSDPHSGENRRIGRHLVKQFQSDIFASVSGDVLDMFVKRYPSCVTSNLLLLLTPPHLRVLDLRRCHHFAKTPHDLQVLKKVLLKCQFLQSLILDEITSNGFDLEALMETIATFVPQLTSISLEHMCINDEHVQILLRGLPNLMSINLSMCSGITDDVFYLSKHQLSELKPTRDSVPYGNHLATVNLSGCQNLTNTCVRHLLELCGPSLRNLNVSCTAMDCTVLWFLSGYGLSSAVQLVMQSHMNQTDSHNESLVKDLLQTMKALQERLEEIKSYTLEEQSQNTPVDVGNQPQEMIKGDTENREVQLDIDTDSNEQTQSINSSSSNAWTSAETYKNEALENRLSSSFAICTTPEMRCELPDSSCILSGTSVEASDSAASSQAGFNTVDIRNEQAKSCSLSRTLPEVSQDAALEVSLSSSLAICTSTEMRNEDLDSSSIIEGNSEEVWQNAAIESNLFASPVFPTTNTDITIPVFEETGADLTSQLRSIEINPVVSKDLKISNLGIASQFRTDSDAQASNTDQEPEDTNGLSGTCEIEDVRLEIGPREQMQQNSFDKNNNMKYGYKSFPEPQMIQDVYESAADGSDGEQALDGKCNKAAHAPVDVSMYTMDSTNDIKPCKFHDYKDYKSTKVGSENRTLQQNHHLIDTCILQEKCNVEFDVKSETFNDQLGKSIAIGDQDTSLNLHRCKLQDKEQTSVGGDGHASNMESNVTSFMQSHSVTQNEFVPCAHGGKIALTDRPIDTLPTKGNHETSVILADSSVKNMNLGEEEFLQEKHSQGNDESGNHATQGAASASCFSVGTPGAHSTGEESSVQDYAHYPINTPSDVESLKNEKMQKVSPLEPENYLNPAAATLDLPRLFEPNIISLDMSFIDIAENVIASCLEDYFSVNQHMQKLVISHKCVTKEMMEIISRNVKELKYFSLYDCPEISNEVLASFLKGCPMLTHLDIQGLSHVGDQGIYPLFELGDSSRLSVIKLAETSITDLTLNRIARTIGPKLQELVLLWCEDITDAGLYQIALHCPSLKTLLLRQRTMRLETLQAFADNCPHLKDVGLSSVSCVDGHLMETIAPKLKGLHSLDVSWNLDLTNEAVSVILSSCPVLSELFLSGIKQITDKPFLPIIANYSKWRRCQILIQLKMREQKMRRDTGMAQLSSDEEYEDLYVPHRSTSYAPSLRNLDLSFCDHMNDKHLQEIVAVCIGTLTIIDYYGEEIMPKLLHSS